MDAHYSHMSPLTRSSLCPQVVTLVVGILVLLGSFGATYLINAKADVLFTGPQDSGSVAY